MLKKVTKCTFILSLSKKGKAFLTLLSMLFLFVSMFSGVTPMTTYAITSASINDGLVLDYLVNQSFNGTSTYIDKTSDVSKVSGLSQGTIVAKIKTTSTATAKTFISASHTTDPSSNISLTMNNGTVYFENRENGVYQTQMSATGTYNDGNWHTVVLIVDSSGTKIYIDNTLNLSNSSTAFFNNVISLNGMWVGRNVDNGGGQWYYSGDIAFIKVYNRTLTGAEIGEFTSAKIPQNLMSALATSQEAVSENNVAQCAIDGNNSTIWHTKWDLSNPLPQSITLNLGAMYAVDQLRYLPRQSGTNGIITGYNLYTSVDGVNFTKFTSGTWANNSSQKNLSFYPVNATHIRLEATAGNGGWASAAEINIYAQGGSSAVAPVTPTDLKATALNQTQIKLNWSQIAGATSYDIDADGVIIQNVNPPYTHTGLLASSTHTYKVRAKNTVGTSNWSSPVSATTYATGAQVPFYEEQILFDVADGLYTQYRIPSIAVTANGTVLAACEARRGDDQSPTDIVLKRSTDGGVTFSQQVILAPGASQGYAEMNPMLLAENTGSNVHLLWSRWSWGNCKYFIMDSTDNGVTWSAARDITYVLDSYKNSSGQYYFAGLSGAGMGPGHGIQLTNGTLVVPIYITTSNWTTSTVASIYSTDGGATWNAGSKVPNPTGFSKIHENMMVQLSNGYLLTNMRNPGSSYRAISKAGTVTSSWNSPYSDQTLIDPVCQASVHRYDSSTILFTNCASSARNNFTIRMSYDDCNTWALSKLIYAGTSGYSDIAVSPSSSNKTIYVFYEKPACTKIALARFNKAWVEAP